MEITREYAKRRSQFGKQPLFSEKGPEFCDSFCTDPKEFKNYILRNPVHSSAQHTKPQSVHEINTIRVDKRSSGINHAEGGWPKDVNTADIEALQRYRRKVEKDDAYINCVLNLSSDLEHYILQNNAVDVYQMYFTELAPYPPVEQNSCRIVSVFRDMPKGRPVVKMCWEPDTGGQKFVATYGTNINGSSDGKPEKALIWDVEKSNCPDKELEAHSTMLDIQYNPRDRNIMVGGCMDGTVVWFDLRKGCNPIGGSEKFFSHRDVAKNVLFINAKNGMEFFSSSPDGQCLWWDCRNIREPLEQMYIDPVKGIAVEQTLTNALGVSCLEFEPTIPTRFMCGTENGMVIGGNRKGKTVNEKLPAQIEAHNSIVLSLERNPTFLKNFLTLGDYNVKIWSEDCKESPIIWTYDFNQKITDATWNPMRFSMFAVSQWDGCLSFWDLLQRQNVPIYTVKISDEPLTKLCQHEFGRLLACGSRMGCIYLTEVSENMCRTEKNDKTLLTAIFERESKREKILEARLREIKLKMKQEEEEGPQVKEEVTQSEADIVEAQEIYFQTIASETKSQKAPKPE